MQKKRQQYNSTKFFLSDSISLPKMDNDTIVVPTSTSKLNEEDDMDVDDQASNQTDDTEILFASDVEEDEATITPHKITPRRSKSHRKMIAKAVKDTASSDSSDDDDDDEEVVEGVYEKQGSDEDDDTRSLHSTNSKHIIDSNVEDNVTYFKQTLSKNVTSNNTLSVLPSLDREIYNRVISRVKSKHITHINKLRQIYQQRFPEWYFSLQCGFNLLFYGYGSKRHLLTNFVQQYCVKHPILVVNGYFPACYIKEILSQICSLVNQDLPNAKNDLTDQVRRISEAFQQPNRTYDRLYLVIHNIDGPNLRTERAVSALSLLAAVPQISVIASIDHIHAPMLWDSLKAHRFNWVYQDVTTFEHYDVEMSFEDFLLMKIGDDLSSKGFRYVLQSVNENTRQLFKLLAETQIRAEEEDRMNMGSGGNDMEVDDNILESSVRTLNNHMDAERTPSKRRTTRNSNKVRGSLKSNMQQNGIPTDIFWTKCRERFIVSSQQQFKQLLSELKDHKVVVLRRRVDGVDALHIPLSRVELEAVLENIL